MSTGPTRAPAPPGVGGPEAGGDRPPPAASWRDVGAGPGWWLAGVLVVLGLVPLTLMGPGTDLDVGAVIRSGRSILDGDYVASRAPGAPVHEAAVGVLEAVGGTVGPNLGSLAAGVAVAVLLAVLLRGEGVGRVGLSVAVVVANPWFLVAATSTVDFLWALALWLGAAVVVRRWPTLAGAAAAGALCGLAVGARSSTAFLVGALALAEAVDRWSPAAVDGTDDVVAARAPTAVVRAAVLTGVAAVVGLVVFLPPFLAAESSLAFAQNDVPTSSPLVQLGRFLAKDLYFVGPFAAVVLLLTLPALGRALGRVRVDWLVRLGVLTVLVSQLLFLRFPWKMGHLLPTLVGLALVLARVLGDRPRLLAALVATQVLYGLVSVQLLAPDNPNAATGGRLTFEPRWGALVVDTQCRLDDTGAWTAPLAVADDPATPEPERSRLDAVWDCAKPWAD
ncbi:hypothetical protein PO878_02090 [Iamia majanohamensis]|uniref:Dolichyl-phosphate-mannose-protein mannosyltransferase n=1 Tax=Iamia majanohamensis TaxID=467976 RepID=A0AAF0BWJ2_9ACTN|nr:hypothetical protein [Iamia majanohamensis]WCO67509.1 hypothetical protein PO878_02090 [Iamia majanohamensis]